MNQQRVAKSTLGNDQRGQGDQQRVDKSTLGHDQWKPTKMVSEVPQYINDLVDSLKKAHDIARENLKAAQELQKYIYNLENRQKLYNVGDTVYKLNQATKLGQSGKFKSPWKGPYIITAVRSPVLSKSKERKSELWLHHDRMKLCEKRELIIWVKRMRNRLMNQNV
ncbi:unnamed protein product [Mytilus coruscus]|uniref:Uncharacterized protein n=1 Tax=Mytilus coruscus TaxID=42192 RepID=A0A6J8CEY8_MYTCO|nr:unnamed protein product [Mytilus coruscus]